MATATYSPKNLNETSPATNKPFDHAAIGRAARELEGVMQEARSMARIANTMIEAALARGFKEARDNGFVSLTFSEGELDDLVFISNEATYRAQVAHDAFYAAIEGRAS